MSYLDIPGWTNFEDLYDEAVEDALDGETLVEVGVAYGRGLAYLARKALDSRKDLAVVGVDPMSPPNWPDDPTWPEETRARIRAYGGHWEAFLGLWLAHAPEELHFVKLLRMSSVEAARPTSSPLEGARISFVFIDADHSYESVRDDIAAWYPRVTSGGRLAGHDYEPRFPGVLQAVDERFAPVTVQRTSWLVDVP